MPTATAPVSICRACRFRIPEGITHTEEACRDLQAVTAERHSEWWS